MSSLTGVVRFHTSGTGRGPIEVSNTGVPEPEEEVLRIEIDVKPLTEQLRIVNDEISLDPVEVRKEYFPFMEPVQLIDDLLKKHA